MAGRRLAAMGFHGRRNAYIHTIGSSGPGIFELFFWSIQVSEFVKSQTGII
jgi:hypothetical protein